MPAYGSDGGPLTHDQTYEQLHKIVSASQTEGAAVGILTSDNRNTWAKVYKRLQKGKIYCSSALDSNITASFLEELLGS